MNDRTPEGLTPPSLARTYSQSIYNDPWEAVEDYQRYLEYAGENPNKGSQAVASVLELPRGRVRTWMDGGRPDAVRAIQVAETRNWFESSFEDPPFRGLNVLTAWIYSGGSISSQNFATYFVANELEQEEVLNRAAQAIDVELRVTRDREENRAREFKPTEHASVLGRVLHLLGAPKGEKNPTARISLPTYLDAAPKKISQEFAATYLLNRQAENPNRRLIRFREERSEGYLEELVEFFSTVTTGSVTKSEMNIHISAEGSKEIDDWAEILSDI